MPGLFFSTGLCRKDCFSFQWITLVNAKHVCMHSLVSLERASSVICLLLILQAEAIPSTNLGSGSDLFKNVALKIA